MPGVAVDVVVPPGVVTTIAWLPDLVVVGMVQVRVVAVGAGEAAIGQAVPPTVTAVAPVKAVPVIATVLSVLVVPMVELGHSPLLFTV